MKYKTIYADPPWQETGGGKIKRGADAHYNLMKTGNICNLPVRDFADENCHLYLWATNNHLQDAFKVIDAWGFRYITIITWFKDKIGLGQYFRGITEQCLFAVKGNLPYKIISGKRAQGKTGFYEAKREHSRKPKIYAKPSLSVNQWGKSSITYYGVNQTSKQWTQLETYGGKLAENITQAVARDCPAFAIENLEAHAFPIVFHVHDEVVIDCPIDKSDLDKVIEIMSQPIPWAKDLPLNADGWIGDFFREE